MKLQWEILLFIFCLNLAFGVIMGLSFPGTEYVNPSGPGINATEYEEHFNATDIAQGWEQSPFTGIPLVGDIYAGFNFLWQNIKYLVDGFPMFLTYISNTYIVDASGQAAFTVVSNVLRAIFAILVVIFLIEFISGRIITD